MNKKQKLGSEEVMESIEHFLREAKECAQTKTTSTKGETGVLGFAAMLTIFSAITAVSEAIIEDRNIEKLFDFFIEKMEQYDSFLIQSPLSTSNNCEEIVRNVRNGLVHAMSLPPKVLLASNKEDANKYMQDNPGQYDCIIGLLEFIEEVEKTVNCLVKDYSDKDFDPRGTKNFGAVRLVAPSGSGGDSTATFAGSGSSRSK